VRKADNADFILFLHILPSFLLQLAFIVLLIHVWSD